MNYRIIKNNLSEWLSIIFLRVKYNVKKFFKSQDEKDFLNRSKIFYSSFIS